jgi:small-conductance mechanosensitive channel
MNTVITPAAELDDLLHALARPSALTELAIAAGCLVLAWLAVRLLRGARQDSASVWFGDHLIDGVLFPVLALALALAARATMQHLGMPVAVFKVVVPVLSSLALIRLAVRVMSAAFPRRGWVIAVERTVSWLAWGAVVLWITGLLPLVLAEMESIRWKVGGTTLNLRTLLEGGVTAVVVMIVALWISAAIEKRLLAGAVDNLSLRKIAANATRALLLFIGLLMALSAVGIDLTALSVLGGAIGVGLGFGLQKLAANYVSGFVILAERSLRIGDMVKVDNFEGRITDINTRYTVIRALNGRESIVPNELLITQRVENSSLADPRVLVQTVVQVAYGSDLDALIPALNAVVADVPRVLADPAPAVQLSAFAADGLELTVNFWIADPENGQGQVRSQVNLALLKALTERGIEIPFPQRVMHPAPATFGGPPSAGADAR